MLWVLFLELKVEITFQQLINLGTIVISFINLKNQEGLSQS